MQNHNNNFQGSISVQVNLNPAQFNPVPAQPVVEEECNSKSSCSSIEESEESVIVAKPPMVYSDKLQYEPIRLDHDPKTDKYSLAGAKDDIKENSLLNQLKIQKKKVQLAVCITIFNEGPEEFQKTVRGVYRAYFELLRYFAYEETEMIVVLIADGFEFLDKEFVKYAEGKFYRSDDLKEYMQNRGGVAISKEIAALDGMDLDKNSLAPSMVGRNFLHLFQARLTASDILDVEGDRIDLKRIRGTSELRDKLPFFLGAKHKNAGKIDSHMWFFRGFCSYLDPTYCLMLDVGTEPLEGAVLNLVTAMELNPKIGGCCGEIEVEFGKQAEMFSAPGVYLVVAAQFIEYKLSHYMDKSFESLFGFVSVLPGAFSAFRWEAVQDEPLDRFFKGRNKDDHSCFEANMYLAEDRVMCLELLVKPECNYILTYIAGSKAVTDPPLHLEQLIKQRRRWINGSTFATFHFIQNFFRIRKTTHGCCRKLGFYFFFLYYVMNTFLTFLLVGSFFGAFSVFLANFFNYNLNSKEIGWYNILQAVYLIVLLALLVLSLTVKPDRANFMYAVSTWVLGGFMMFTMFITVYYFVTKKSKTTTLALVFIIASLASYIVPIIINIFRLLSHLVHVIIGLPTYIMITPTYVNTFVIFAFANLHDVSWGNRQTIEDPVEKMRRENLEEDYKGYRKNILLVWIIANGLYGYGIIFLASTGNDVWLLIISVWIGTVLYIRMLGAILYKVKTVCGRSCHRRKVRQLLRKKMRKEKHEELQEQQALEDAAEERRLKKEEERLIREALKDISDSESEEESEENSEENSNEESGSRSCSSDEEGSGEYSNENSQMLEPVQLQPQPLVVNVMLGPQPGVPQPQQYQQQQFQQQPQHQQYQQQQYQQPHMNGGMNGHNNGTHNNGGFVPVNLDP